MDKGQKGFECMYREVEGGGCERPVEMENTIWEARARDIDAT